MEMNSDYQQSGKGILRSNLHTLLCIIVVMVSIVSARDCILTFRQMGKDFEDVYLGVSEELGSDFDVKEVAINKKSDVSVITEAMNAYHPKLVILMDNTTIALYKKYQATLGPDAEIIPSVSLMGVMIKDAIADLKNAAGISYEIPIVTSIVSLRAILGLPMKKVGVVNREFLKDFLSQNREFCKREGIEIVNESLPNKSDSYRMLLKKALENLVSKNIEALWIPNDNALLHPELIKNVWLPFVKKYRIPVVVGVEVLVTPKINLGTFAVLPDHVALGTQAAEIVYDIMDNGWKVDKMRVDPPLAVYKIINLLQAKKSFNVSDEKLKAVDKKLR